jgi:drug/metabolite transporter (DMT)-like permease
MGVLGIINQACYIKAVSFGDASAVVPADYMRLVFAIGMGLFVFHETPDLVATAGAAVVIVSTFYITFWDRRVRVAQSKPRGLRPDADI